MDEKAKEAILLIKDTIDNLRGSLELAMPPAFHVEQMKEQLEDLGKRLAEVAETEIK